MILRLALTSFHHRSRTIAVWLGAVVAVLVLGSQFGGSFSNGGRLAGTDSDKAYRLFEASFPAQEAQSEAMVFKFRQPVGDETKRDPRVEARVKTFLASARATKGVREVVGPFDQGALRSSDGTIVQSSFVLPSDDNERTAAVDSLTKAAAKLKSGDVRVEFGSGWFSTGGLDGSGEIIGIAAAVVILLLAFGSIVAMGVPIVTALIGVAIGGGSIGLWARLVDTPQFTTQVAIMVGLGVGIDYALFIITRYRHALAMEKTPEQAITEAMNSAGRAVVFAGSIVVVSLLGMILIGLPFLYGLAVGTAATVLVAVLAAITLLPALLGLMGNKVSARAKRSAHSSKETLWHRWGRLVQRRAVAFCFLGAAVLVTLVVPVGWMRLANADHGNSAKGTTNREAYNLVSEGFGRGANGPLIIVAATPDAMSRKALDGLASSLTKTDGIASVLDAQRNSASTVSVLTVIPTSGPQDSATTALVHRLRNDVIPAAQAGSTLRAHVGGQTASDIDFAQIMGDRLPIFIGSVLAFSFVLLLLVFGSLLVPLKAVVLNLLSIGAAYGAMVAVFQWGWFGSLVGIHGGAPIAPWAPMMLFAIVFGLSMDYEVFLLSAIKERFDHSGDNSKAVVDGLAATARVITAAAAIMIMVFGGFLTNDDRSIKMIGFGLASAVFIDATLVRMLLVPATMELLGAKNWWMPKVLRRVLPKVSIEG